jgi:superfamily II DNA or RNA helicase
MDLSTRCKADFDARDWRRGQEYLSRGAVSIVDQWPNGIEAAVQGSRSEPYQVGLDWSQADQQTLVVYCSCPRFADVGACKHVAATILAADIERISTPVPGRGPLYTEPADLGGPASEDDEPGGWDDDYEPAVQLAPRGMRRSRTSAGRKRARDGAAQWKQRLATVGEVTRAVVEHFQPGRAWSRPREMWYLLDVARTMTRGWPCISLRQRTLRKDGTPGALKAAKLKRQDAAALASPDDRMLVGMLAGNDSGPSYGYSYYDYEQLSDFAIAPAMFEVLLPRLCASGRFGWQEPVAGGKVGEIHHLAWDDGPPWRLRLEADKTADGRSWRLDGVLERDGTREDLRRPLFLLVAGLVAFPDRLARLEAGEDFGWVGVLRSGPLVVPLKQTDALVESLVQIPRLPPVDLPPELRWEEEAAVPTPMVRILRPGSRSWQRELECHLAFQYGQHTVSFAAGPDVWFDRLGRRAMRRDRIAEGAARDRLTAAGAKSSYYHERNVFLVPPARLPKLVAELSAAGWQVEAEGRLIRQPGALSLSLSCGTDWFDLEGTCDFGGHAASLPELLAALKRGEQFVELDDGSHGMLPEQWLARYAGLAELGQAEGERLRFKPNQAALLDALLAAQGEDRVHVDQAFAELRDRLRSFAGIRPAREPETFVGELRPYQREGLGWLHFLDEFSFGGCLADDMGLGKTVQILALLDERRQARGRTPHGAGNGAPRRRARSAKATAAPPSLVVVPRSLVFNWIEEAARFTPELRVLNYTGLARREAREQVAESDLVVTTYGTLRRDIAELRDVEFDYAILDEAQAIKNPASQAAKACRLIKARRRLAMTGTPVENHLGELWSLFEFLNPGMLGRSGKLAALVPGNRGRGAQDDRQAETLALLARALRPFMLRRTKQQVLADLPEKTEQTLYCELAGPERARYDELREHYRRTLLERIGKVGVNKSKIHVLEALLRLRQAACHPGLLDKKQTHAGSAKLETLLAQLSEVIDEGHKALVFSQFTSLLAIVRNELDDRGLVYEYLDGRTTKRQERVARFQDDPACPLFLISLKAGGQGLNLTAADYVFILDPWWNPAVEAQAVDRAHRIGQSRRVFAYRLIARDTVEEKIVQLQGHKRALADAIITADNSLLRNLTAEDLQLLLS